MALTVPLKALDGVEEYECSLSAAYAAR